MTAWFLVLGYVLAGIVATVVVSRRCTYTGARWFYPVAVALCVIFWPAFILDGIKD